MARAETPTGQELRRLKPCADCGGRLRNDRPTKRCSRCGETKPVSDYHHARNRADHRTVFCKPCRTALDRTRKTGHHTGLTAKRKNDEYPPLRPLGSYSPVCDDVVVGIVENVERVFEWADVDPYQHDISKRQRPAFTKDGREIHKVTLTDAYYASDPVLAPGYGKVVFVTDQGDYVEGETVTVEFDAHGNATKLTQEKVEATA